MDALLTGRSPIQAQQKPSVFHPRAHNETLSVGPMCVLPNGHLIVEGCLRLALSCHQISPVITAVVSEGRETRNRGIFGSNPHGT